VSIDATDADFVEMSQQVGWIGVDSIRASALQLVVAIPAGQHANPKRTGAPRGEQVPHAVAYHDGRFDTYL
jgi:hypothetical protein